MNIQDMPIVTNEQIMDSRKAAIELKQENTAYAITVQNLEAELEHLKRLRGVFKDTSTDINKIMANAINDLISSKFTNVYIEGCERPVIYVEDAHVYANNLEGKSYNKQTTNKG